MTNKKTVSSNGRKGKLKVCEMQNLTIGSTINNSVDHVDQSDSFWNRD